MRIILDTTLEPCYFTFRSTRNKDKTMKVMLATKGDIDKLPFEGEMYIATPKLDGIRCFIHPELGPVTRTLKPIPNKYIRERLSNPALVNLDGEITVGNTFSDCQSAVMSHEGEPDFQFVVFDKYDTVAGYAKRYIMAKMTVNRIRHEGIGNIVVMVQADIIKTREELEKVILDDLETGYEGTMLRLSDSPYKHGRSTLKQAYLLKFKPIADCEIEVEGQEQLIDIHGNQQAKLGAMYGKVLAGPHKGASVHVGTGFTTDQRKDLFGKDLKGLVATVEYQDLGSKDTLRFPSFKGFRDRKDF